ncbi:MAG: NADH-quinone oxidoreductase subunit L [Caldilineae bacterium]|nr:MAG: NADH-quinone oxidoreductase subunit L [Caldilineae bacterium]
MFSLTPLIPVFPLLAFALIVLWANKNNKLSAGLAIGGIAISTLLSWVVIAATIAGGKHAQVEGWSLPVPWMPAADGVFKMGFAVDGFTAAMLFMVPLVCTLIFIYASEYMEGDPRYARFFAYVSLFAFGMLALVVADNLLLLFIAWEVMGLCSYLLIGFWFEKDSAKKAALKAFLTTRIGDVLLFAGMLFLYSHTGTLTFRQIFEPQVLEELTHATIWGMPAATVIALLIFGGAVGKSAQFPLHVWLPDAMEGPTPVSALIHAATMVSAGVYLVARTLPLFAVMEGTALQWVVIIGSITAFFGATIGVAQNDIKRVLAYSTISQLGYMMIGLGLGGFLAGIFHLLTHAFFKALLFLGSGSVIHAVEHGAHETHDHHTDPQDMMNMGGLYGKMKRTAWAYFIATGALIGLFPLAGFWSKDEILAEAWLQWQEAGTLGLPFWAWLAGTAGAFVTALYMGRQIGLVFFGQPRTEAAAHAHEPGNRMTVPLLVLAFFAAVIGFINVPFIAGGWLHHFAGEVHEVAAEAAHGLHLEAVPFQFSVAIVSTIVALLGFGIGFQLYRNLKAGEQDPLARMLGPLFTLLKNKYYIDELYQEYVVNVVVDLATFCAKFDYDWVINPIVDLVGATGRWFSDFSGKVDEVVVDGLGVLGTARFFRWMGQELRLTQTGQAQNYLLVIVLVSLSLVGIYLFGLQI